MNYNNFRKTVHDMPVIFTRDLLRGKPDRQAILNQLERWRKRALIIQLKRGLYMLNRSDRKIEPSRMYIANQLYGPSYISLEYALGYYGLIPERVTVLTSVTSRKTARITNEIGSFVYQHIQPEPYRGFVAMKDENGLMCFLAEPEKAVIDFIYLNLEKFKSGDKRIFEESYRFQNMESLKSDKLARFAGYFHSKKLIRVVGDLLGIIKEGAV